MKKIFCKQSGHQDRMLQLMCMEKQCPNKFNVKCLLCISKGICKKHNWKPIVQIIQSIYQLVEMKQFNLQHQEQLNKDKNQIIIKQIQKTFLNIRQKLNDVEKAMIQQANNLISQSQPQYKKIKKLLKEIKNGGSQEEIFKNLNFILEKMSYNQQNQVFYFPNQTEEKTINIFAALEQKLAQLQNFIGQLTTNSHVTVKLQDTLQDQKKTIQILNSRIDALQKKNIAKDNKYNGLINKIKSINNNQNLGHILQKLLQTYFIRPQLFNQKEQDLLFSKLFHQDKNKSDTIDKRINKLKVIRQNIFKQMKLHTINVCLSSLLVTYDYSSKTYKSINKGYCCFEGSNIQKGFLWSELLFTVVDQMQFLGLNEGINQRKIKSGYLEIRKNAKMRKELNIPCLFEKTLQQ